MIGWNLKHTFFSVSVQSAHTHFIPMRVHFNMVSTTVPRSATGCPYVWDEPSGNIVEQVLHQLPPAKVVKKAQKTHNFSKPSSCRNLIEVGQQEKKSQPSPNVTEHPTSASFGEYLLARMNALGKAVGKSGNLFTLQIKCLVQLENCAHCLSFAGMQPKWYCGTYICAHVIKSKSVLFLEPNAEEQQWQKTSRLKWTIKPTMQLGPFCTTIFRSWGFAIN